MHPPAPRQRNAARCPVLFPYILITKHPYSAAIDLDEVPTYSAHESRELHFIYLK